MFAVNKSDADARDNNYEVTSHTVPHSTLRHNELVKIRPLLNAVNYNTKLSVASVSAIYFHINETCTAKRRVHCTRIIRSRIASLLVTGVRFPQILDYFRV